MAKRLKLVVIPKEHARFRLDEHGNWHNESEKFTNKKIIHYFHSCIRRDKDGYHLAQVHSTHKEKVYFPYEDTALFVFEVIKGEEINLVLNNGKRIKMKPKSLIIRGDSLYMKHRGDLIKFSQHALIRIAELIEDDGDGCYVRIQGRRFRIEESKP